MPCPPCDGTLDTTHVEWAIPESILSILWDHVFQRVIVFRWYIELHLMERGAGGGGDYPIDDNVLDVLAGVPRGASDYFPNIAANIVPPMYPLGDPTVTLNPASLSQATINAGRLYLIRVINAMQADPDISEGFKGMLAELEAYLEIGRFLPNTIPGPIPIYFIQLNGYDYALSEFGIELAFPPRPQVLDEDGMVDVDLFRKFVFSMYEKRPVGVDAITVPPGPDSFSTTPGRPHPRKEHQIRTVRSNPADNNIEALLPPSGVSLSTSITTFATSISPVAPATVESDALGSPYYVRVALALARNILGIEDDLDCAGVPIISIPITNVTLYCAFERFLMNIAEPPSEISVPTCVSVSVLVEAFLRRKWFLSGSVFRRIAADIPRLKAGLWIDNINGDGARKGRYTSNANCRKLIEERLEISLPVCEDMYFKGAELMPAAPLPATASTTDDDGDADDEGEVADTLLFTTDPDSPVPGLPQEAAIVPNESLWLAISDLSERERVQSRDIRMLGVLRGILPYRPNEVYIHNCGVSLPAIGVAPSEASLYASWKNGAAANPVMTDTIMTS